MRRHAEPHQNPSLVSPMGRASRRIAEDVSDVRQVTDVMMQTTVLMPH
jgi:hypothetical protein